MHLHVVDRLWVGSVFANSYIPFENGWYFARSVGQCSVYFVFLLSECETMT